MFKKIFIVIVFFLLIVPCLYSQHKGIKGKTRPKTVLKEGDYEPKTVVLKIKKEYQEILTTQKFKLSSLAKIGTDIKLISLKKMFPESSSPRKQTNKLGQPLSDISLIYTLKYSADLDVLDVADRIFATGLVEYAEPQFTDKILLIPNDDSVATKQDFYFSKMQAYDAFAIEEGDTNVVVGIIDTGVRWLHEDLVENIKYNYGDPIDGIDNDGDGYVDNFRGWDLGMNDNDPDATGNEHGTFVAGCAGASTNNTVGMMGTGFKCKILPIKASTDNPASSIVQGYPAIIYAADHDCKVINLSWGGAGSFSAAAQDIINYAAINKDAVIVAAAGNDDTDHPFYPASYDHVLSVAGLDTMYNAVLDSFIEVKASWATYNYYVDVGALGRRVFSTLNNGSYNTGSGSSYSSPLVAGAAALVRSGRPTLNALQVAELLRVTADPLVDSVTTNISYKNEKLGKGRINMYKALTDNTLPAIRNYNRTLDNNYGEYAFSGDSVKLKCDFRNYLQPTNNAVATLSTTNPYITIVKATNNLGSIPTLDSFSNYSDPFIFYVDPSAPKDEHVVFRLGYSDPVLNYDDYQYFEIDINPGYLDIDTNQITLTVTSKGRFGYDDEFTSVGSGLVYQGQSILYEGGLMISTNDNSKVSDCVRSSPAGFYDSDFSISKYVRYVPSPEGDMESKGIMTDTASVAPLGLSIEQRTYAHSTTPNDKFIIIEYDITNISGDTIDSLNVGLFNDWDIQNYNQNKCDWIAEDSIGYTYYTGASGIYAGVCLLTNNPPACYSMENGNTGGNNINPNDGYTTLEKHTTLSSGVARPSAGGAGFGFDVSQVVGGVLRQVLNNEKRTIAFAYVVGDDLLDLKTSARQAKDLFRSLNTSNTPIVADFHYCNGNTESPAIIPGNGTIFNFYQSPTDLTPVHTGASYTISNITVSDTIYVRGIDSLFESATTSSKIYFHAELEADFGMAPDTLDLADESFVYFVDKSENATQITWDMGDGTVRTDDPGFMHQYATTGTYKVLLTATGAYGCADTISKNVVIKGIPNTNFPIVLDGIKMYPNPTSGILHLDFIYASPQNLKISIYNTLGEEMLNTEFTNITFKNYEVDLSTYKKGVYVARIQIGDKPVTRIFVLQ